MKTPNTVARRFAIGAEPLAGEGTHFRVWAPAQRTVEVVEWREGEQARPRRQALEAEAGGYFSGFVPGLGAGDRYGFRLGGEDALYPDPASRLQPDGPHGPSEIVDPGSFRWTDAAFGGVRESQVLYELHLGTFTPEGTYRAAAAELAELARLGITTLELMPLADFPGRFGWGYDGVDLWAPTRLYGKPDELRSFVDRAHAHGLAVILDVVYNHLGPDGNFLKHFSRDYFTDRYENEWGEPINFDGPNSAPVREFFVENARYWIDEYHLDGFRLDATQSLFDASERHVIAEIVAAARAVARQGGRRIYVVAENEPQQAKLVRAPERGGYDCDALWNDDFHHSAMVALTGRREAYYTDYAGGAQELISAVKWGYLYQGQHYHWQKAPRGRPALDVPARSFVAFLQNHDQIANSLAGARVHELTSAAKLRAMTTLLLLAPATPMLFQGQEFAASSPFLYFADQKPELSALVREDRVKFLAQFPSIALPECRARLADPSDPETFERCKLDFGERERHAGSYRLHRDLLALRHGDPAFAAQRADLVHGAVLGPDLFSLRFLCDAGDRLLVVNLGPDRELAPVSEPLLAPPEGATFRLVFSSEHPDYGGSGAITPFSDAGIWKFTANSSSVLVAAPGRSEA